MSEFFLIDPAALTTILAIIAALLTGAIVGLITFYERPTDVRFGATHRWGSSPRGSSTHRTRRHAKPSRDSVFEARRRQH